MSSNPLRLKYLFNKYLDNTCSKADLKEFWLLMSELSDGDLVELDLKDLWNQIPQKPNGAEKGAPENLYLNLKQRIANQELNYVKLAKSNYRRPYVQLAVAASLLICITLSWLIFNRNTKQETATVKTVYSSSARRVLTLPDGTTVTLYKQSTLDYPLAFRDATRDVYLNGEAYFDVKHNAAQPFIVHTRAFFTKVLGTAFYIKANPEDTKVSVTVTRGKVQVQRSDNKKILGILLPGYRLTVNNTDQSVLASKVDVREMGDLENNNMVFEDLTFEVAAIRLGRHFNVELKFRNPELRHCRFTANFNNESLDQALDIICQLTGSNWHKEGEKVIWVDGKGCN